VIYPVRTLSQLPLVLKGFRKEKGLTQAAIAERLGITQQSYAYFEANPATATLERLFMVLRILDVDISLNQTSHFVNESATPALKLTRKAPGTVAVGKKQPVALVEASRILAPARKKESW
jgi:HTH-type transcriptional regulator / antitoxin HipB